MIIVLLFNSLKIIKLQEYLVVRKRVQNKVVSIEHIKNTFMLADPLTKALPPKLFMDYVAHMGLVASL